MFYPHAQEQAYKRMLMPIAVACDKAMRDTVFPALKMLGLPYGTTHMDAVLVDFGSLFRLAARTVITGYDLVLLRELLEERAEEVDTFQRKQLTRRLEKATLIGDLAGRMLAAEAAKALTEKFVKENVALIVSLPEKVFAQMERKVIKAVSEGERVETLQANLEGTYGVGKAKAELLARDQMGKLYGQLNETRQKAVGINTYIWRGVLDERERETHLELEGKVFSWDDPPVTNDKGDRNHPGQDYECRCTAEPNLDEIFEAQP